MTDGQSSAYQVCTRCVIDTTDPEVTFDAAGVCNYCHRYDTLIAPFWKRGAEGQQALEAIVAEMKAYGKGKEYDCLIGLSGGADSCYMAYVGHRLGLRMLALHVDGGWNSELAVKNIENICKKLDIDLITDVIDWNTMKGIQKAFFRSRVINQDIPQDHAFFAALYKYAMKNNIKYVLNGNNIATENTIPDGWRGYMALDSVHLKDVCRKNGNPPLKNFPLINYFNYAINIMFFKKIKVVFLLNYIEYNKEDAKKELFSALGWVDYGAKHHESRFTKFHQTYYLPTRFNIDKRKAHLASMILSGYKTREEALEELKKPPFKAEELDRDIEYIAKKLGMSRQEFDEIMQMPPGRHEDYKASQAFYKRNAAIFSFIKKIIGKVAK